MIMPFLSVRNTALREKMDHPDCNRDLLFNTYQQFTSINKLLGRWKSIYKKRIRPVIEANQGKATLLDIGCGGGDIIRFLNHLTKNDGLDVQFTGIEPDQRAIEYLQQQTWDENIRFEKSTSTELVAKNKVFDVIISNHLIHHLLDKELEQICSEVKRLSKHLVLFNDIERSRIGYRSFQMIAPLLFRNSFIVEDGLTSIKRSYRRDELKRLLPDGWHVHRKFPFRLIAIYQKS